MDHENHYINLTDANLQFQSLKWMREYSAKISYNMSSLEPTEWNSFYEKMSLDDNLFQAYYNHYHRYSDAFSKECDDDCRKGILDSIPIYDTNSCKSNI